MTAAGEARAEAAEAAWGVYRGEHGYMTVPTSPDSGADFSGGFEAGWDVREAEVAALTAQLQAAQATIAEALVIKVDTERGIIGTVGRIRDVLSRADTSALAERDKQVAAKALRDAADDIEPSADVDPETVTAIYDPYDVADLLRARAASVESTEAK